MGLFLVLSPFATLSAMLAIAPAAPALFTAAAVAFGLVVLDRWRGRSLKLLQVGTTFLFMAIGLYVVFVDREFGGTETRMTVDMGLLAIALLSLALRFPFTIQYARETVDADVAARPEFWRANYVVTGVWTAAFAMMLVADLGTLYISWLPFWTGLAAAFAARNAAACFTQWYAARQRARTAGRLAAQHESLFSSAAGDIA